ncbi:MAG: hypothetical protein M3Z66_00115, partial [Chloroflexota bacterium]|nr:hypothetical protein [Chloroflexota bacterium]
CACRRPTDRRSRVHPPLPAPESRWSGGWHEPQVRGVQEAPGMPAPFIAYLEESDELWATTAGLLLA